MKPGDQPAVNSMAKFPVYHTINKKISHIKNKPNMNEMAIIKIKNDDIPNPIISHVA